MKKLLLILGVGSFTMLAVSSTCSSEASMPVSKTQPIVKAVKTKIDETEGIKFAEMNLAQAKAEAAKTGKLIFIDAYTEWCGPCKIMAKTSFKDPKVGDFFNSNFINLKIEMEKDADGREVAMKYSVKAYPTLLIINSNGDLVKQTLGLQSAERLLDFGKSAVK